MTCALLVLLGCTPTDQGGPNDDEPDTATEIEVPGALRVLGQDLVGEHTIVAANWPEDEQRLFIVDAYEELVSEYPLPAEMLEDGGLVMDFELLDSGHLLVTMWHRGIFEIDSEGEIVGFHEDPEASHDVDRLESGKLLIARTWAERGEPQLVLAEPDGNIEWAWNPAQHYGDDPRFLKTGDEGWMHITSVQRLDDGTKRVCLRNFDLIVDIDEAGRVSREFEVLEGARPHGLETLDQGDILYALREPHRIVQVGKDGLVWEWQGDGVRTIRDVDRLPNGNTLFTAQADVIEVDESGEIVWEWSVPELHSGEAEEFTPLMAAVRIREDGTFSNR